ncbi:MAG: mechanosensitive ion channel family protein [Oligoflexales bacterium]
MEPVETSNPAKSLMSFVSAMKDYRKGIHEKNPVLSARIKDAVRALNLEKVPALLKADVGAETAVFLKEILDRLDPKVLMQAPNRSDLDFQRWVIPKTEIVILKVEAGERGGDFLFSPETVRRAKEFYQKVEHLPFTVSEGGAFYEKPWFEAAFPEWLQYEFLGLFQWQWLGVLSFLFLSSVFRGLFFVVWARASRVSFSSNEVLEALELARPPLGMMVIAGTWWIGIRLLRFDGYPLQFFVMITQVLLSVASIWLIYRFSNFLEHVLRSLASRTDSPLDDQLVPILSKALRACIVIFGVLLVLQNLGINVMSLLAGVGLGGLAFALAAKDTAANLFGSVMILWDQPFKSGDYIKVGTVSGVVTEVGFRSTRIRTFYDSEVAIPNADMANQKIDNMGKRVSRRTVTTLQVVYSTPADTLEAFIRNVKNLLKERSEVNPQVLRVAFDGFGASSLDIMLYFFLDVSNYEAELKVREEIFLSIMKLAKEMEVDFAYPTRTMVFDAKSPLKIQSESSL